MVILYPIGLISSVIFLSILSITVSIFSLNYSSSTTNSSLSFVSSFNVYLASSKYFLFYFFSTKLIYSEIRSISDHSILSFNTYDDSFALFDRFVIEFFNSVSWLINFLSLSEFCNFNEDF